MTPRTRLNRAIVSDSGVRGQLSLGGRIGLVPYRGASLAYSRCVRAGWE